MPLQKTSREDILEKAIELINLKGYGATSMADLAQACGLLKGSFYHYFKSKEDLTQAVLQYAIDFFETRIFSVAYEDTLTPSEKMEKMLRRHYKVVSHQWQGCLFGNIALETSPNMPVFQTRIQAFFEAWQAAFQQILLAKYSIEEAKKQALVFVAQLEGAIMLMKIHQSEQPFWLVADDLKQKF